MEQHSFDARMHTSVDMPHANHAPDFSQEIMHNGGRGGENAQIIRGDEQHGRPGGAGRTGPIEMPSPAPDGRRPPIEMPSPGPDGRRPPIEMPSPPPDGRRPPIEMPSPGPDGRRPPIELPAPRPKCDELPATQSASQIRELDFSANCPFGERHR